MKKFKYLVLSLVLLFISSCSNDKEDVDYTNFIPRNMKELTSYLESDEFNFTMTADLYDENENKKTEKEYKFDGNIVTSNLNLDTDRLYDYYPNYSQFASIDDGVINYYKQIRDNYRFTYSFYFQDAFYLDDISDFNYDNYNIYDDGEYRNFDYLFNMIQKDYATDFAIKASSIKDNLYEGDNICLYKDITIPPTENEINQNTNVFFKIKFIDDTITLKANGINKGEKVSLICTMKDFGKTKLKYFLNSEQVTPYTYKYLSDSDSYELNYNFNKENCVLPSTYDDGIHGKKDITVLSKGGTYKYLDKDNTITKSVTLPKNLKEIDEAVFYRFKNLKNITFPQSLKTIDKFAFYECNSLLNLVLPTNLEYINDSAFTKCDSLTKIVIPNNVKTIEEDVFAYCTSLDDLVLPTNLEYIKDEAFYKCESLPTINFPNSVKEIGANAFAYCVLLEELELPTNLEYIKDEAFYKCESLLTINFSNSVKEIGANAFAYCTLLEKLELPINLEYIKDGAFYKCESLPTLSFPNSVKEIGAKAFYQCTGFEYFNIPQNLKTIGDYAFYECINIKYIGINDTNSNGNYELETIGISAFESCELITSITLPNNKITLKAKCFLGCYSMGDIIYK